MLKYTIILGFFLIGCKTQTQLKSPIQDEKDWVTAMSPTEEETERRLLDEIKITAPKGFVLDPYRAAATREFDLIHTDLDLRFDWVNEHVLGRADLTLRPFFYPRRILTLDAKGFDILSITTQYDELLTYEYDNRQIFIDLGREYTRFEEIRITIDYTAKPSEGPIGGSAAITSDKGLFFINARNEIPNKPRQIWTQGETENNSRWFPTIDKPNENTTQDIRLTVEEKFVTLSNGKLISSKNNEDGTRTDHWQMTQPHAPYLIMIAVGEYAVVKDNWNGIEVNYYVEAEYESHAKKIFEHTPEMIEFFSNLLSYTYPWEKFSQVITRDYVSGAMENTSAVIYGDFVQKTSRELIDNDNDYIIAHELFHHWFGNLVTCESWSNLTLNEGFANYSEYLWQEYKYGQDAAGFKRMNERMGYLNSITQTGTLPLINFHFNDKEDMFNAHSYNKGGLVLHMLRHYLGDEAFFSSLNKYLIDNAYSSVEADELRLSCEEVSGQDLNWFFDQWFFDAGHPFLKIEYAYDSMDQNVIITIDQTQNPESNAPIFQLPVGISVFDSNGLETVFDIWLDQRHQQIMLPYDTKPALIIFDKEDILLFQKKETKSVAEYANQYLWSPSFAHRHEAIFKIKNKTKAQHIIIAALDDTHFSIRTMAISALKIKKDTVLAQKLSDMAYHDPHSSVRARAIQKLKNVKDFDLTALVQNILKKEQAYPVISAAIQSIGKKDINTAVRIALQYQDERTDMLTSAIASTFAKSGDPIHVDYFEKRLTSVNTFMVFSYYDWYYDLVSQLSADIILEKAQNLKNISLSNASNVFFKFVSTNMLDRLKAHLMPIDIEASKSIGEIIEEIRSSETNDILLERYKSF